jgi:glycerol-3-phosphate acyltransferase PlsY
MSTITQLVVGSIVGFLLGSIPTGYIAGRRMRGIDLRAHGSGNLGSTNVYRTLGVGAAIAVVLVDVGKGALAVWLGSRGWPRVEQVADLVPLVSGLAAIVGHSFSPWVGFRGGKGVATAAGAFLTLAPWGAVPAALLWLLLLLTTRIMSVASLAAAAVLPICIVVHEFGAPGEHRPWATLASSVLVAVLVFVRHRGNLQRLRAGNEKGLW